MRIAITGGFGYIGSSCASYFQKKGHDVTIFARKVPEFLKQWSRNFEVVICDITGPKINFGSEAVIHCASLNETKDMPLEEFIRVNCGGTKNAIEACIRNSVEKFIRISTFHAYGVQSGTITEKTNPQPTTRYGISNMLSDEICKEYAHKLNTAVLRFSNVFGAPVHPGIDRWSIVVNNFCMQAMTSGRIALNSTGRQKRDFVALSDSLSSIELVINEHTGSGEIFNVGGGRAISIIDAAKRVAKNYEAKYGRQADIVIGNKEEPEADFTFSIEKIRKMGYEPKADMDDVIMQIFDSREAL